MKSVKFGLLIAIILSLIPLNTPSNKIIIAKEKLDTLSEIDYSSLVCAIQESPIFKIEEHKPCSDGMVEIDSDYCPYVKEVCLKWKDSYNPYPRMCEKFQYPTQCVSKQIHLHFCIDKYEAQTERGQLPEVFIDWFTADAKCKAVGKRLCDVKELTLACEGPERKPYPYGYNRNIKKCNVGHQWIDPDKNPFEKIDKRTPTGSFETCKSEFGVYDIVGNVDEWSVNTEGTMKKAPFVSALFGGHYVDGIRNRCRDNYVPSITTSHGPTAKNYEISYRCCSDVL